MIAIIPARGGSVRIPRKNIKPFHGRPIIEYAIETAKKSGLFSDVVVSTDDVEIAKIAASAGASIFMRESDDGSKGTQEVARDVLMVLPRESMACVIYATSPLLTTEDLQRGYMALKSRTAQYTMSVQTDPLADAGCFYFGWAHGFRNKSPLIAPHTAMIPLPPERCQDINTLDDWAIAESKFDALRRVT